jgi:hypothetical protein
MSLLPEHPREVARLLNPPFCAALIQRSVEGYVSTTQSPMLFALTYLVLPIVLHEPTRVTLPRSNVTKFSTWVLEHPEVRAGFPSRCHALMPFATAGLSFLLGTQALGIDDRGYLMPTGARLRGITTYPKKSDEIGRCWSRALLFGQLLGSVPRPARVLISLGVRP